MMNAPLFDVAATIGILLEKESVVIGKMGDIFEVSILSSVIYRVIHA
ncbi:hypothetical protein [Shimia sp. MMG029]|nr:hypothetical protein [Shimia sp. MMG029]MDA5558069.1 hypothetical protein [Shimia sp. MMG029]